MCDRHEIVVNSWSRLSLLRTSTTPTNILPKATTFVFKLPKTYPKDFSA